jgi:hypothetical protein
MRFRLRLRLVNQSSTSLFLLLLHLHLLLSLFTLVSAQISTVNGQALYSATPVQQHPHGIPTLAYNCAKLPSICENVNRRNPLNRIPAGLTTLQGVNHVELHYDTNSARRDARRGTVCPNNWKNHHPCPETNPRQPNTVPQGAALGTGGGSYPPARYNPNGLTMGDPAYNTIANASGGTSGMIWSCDEWPPAM